MLLLVFACGLTAEFPDGTGEERGFASSSQSRDAEERSTRSGGSEAGFPFATLLEPLDGETVMNPVNFRVDYAELSELEVYADEWLLGSMLPKGTLTYTFSGVDRPRLITLRARDLDGKLLPTESITITPVDEDASDGFTWVPYFFQYDNLYSPNSTCGLTSAAMMLGARGSKQTPDQLYLTYGKAQGQSPEGLAQLYAWEGYSSASGRRGTRSELRAMLDAGDPVVVHGFWTNAGHIAVLVGYDESGWVVNDPAGDWNSGYGTRTGESVHYPFGGGWDKRLSVDGDIWWSTAR